MDFFAQQDSARRRTGLLVALYLFAVVLIVFTVYFVFVLVASIGASSSSRADAMRDFGWFVPEVFFPVAGVTAAIIGLGTLFKILMLRSGGRVVAEALGGRPISGGGQDPSEQRFQNIVEEMSIASGVPVPAIYVLDEEPGINAFAAGHGPQDAVVAVTRGALENLKRDELQGVIGHEFSHVLNGDMRLNLRLIGVLNGILLLAIVGRVLVRALGRTRGGSSKDGQAKAALLLLGVALLVIGSLGALLARVIQSAVSRQREYLADAAAVQFTRNPGGLAGALRRIARLEAGSRVESPHASEASHLFFSDSRASWFGGLFATHPPIAERIRRLEGAYAGMPESVPAGADALTGNELASAGAAGFAPSARSGRIPLAAGEAVRRAGTMGPEQILRSAKILQSIPVEIAAAAREPFGSRAVVFAALLDAREDIRARQFEALRALGDEPVLAETQRLALPVGRLPRESRHALVDIAIPAIRTLSPSQATAFESAVRALAEADNQVELFEYAIYKGVLRGVRPILEGRRPAAASIYSLKPIRAEAAALLSALARAGAPDPAAAQKAFEAGARMLEGEGGGGIAMLPPASADLAAVDLALEALASAAPGIKRRVLAACAACIGADGTVTSEEGELFRAISNALDCPQPTFAETPAR